MAASSAGRTASSERIAFPMRTTTDPTGREQGKHYAFMYAPCRFAPVAREENATDGAENIRREASPGSLDFGSEPSSVSLYFLIPTRLKNPACSTL